MSMSAFLASPVWGAILTIGGTAILAVFGLIWRLSSKVDRIADKVDELGKDIVDLRQDSNLIRWSDLRAPRLKRRRREF